MLRELPNATELVIAWITEGFTKFQVQQVPVDVHELVDVVKDTSEDVQQKLSLHQQQTQHQTQMIQLQFQNLQERVDRTSETLQRKVQEQIAPLQSVLTRSDAGQKGRTGEKLYAEWVIPQISSSWITENTSKIPNSGDYIHEHRDDHTRVMSDVKNYINSVGSSEIEKLWRDMETQRIRYGVLVSIKSDIVRRRPILDLEARSVDGQMSYVLYYSCMQDHKELLAMGLELLRSLSRSSPVECDRKVRSVRCMLEDLEVLQTSLDTLEKSMKKALDHHRTCFAGAYDRMCASLRTDS